MVFVCCGVSSQGGYDVFVICNLFVITSMYIVACVCCDLVVENVFSRPVRFYIRISVLLYAFVRHSVYGSCSSFGSTMELTEMATNLHNNKSFFLMNGSVLRSVISLKTVVLKRIKTTCADVVEINSSTTDITLIIDNQKLSAHKNVLSDNCIYFDIMFTKAFKEQTQCEIKLNNPGISYETLKTLIKFFYDSKLTITEENVQDLLISSNILLLDDVKEACTDYLKSMISVENCIDLKNIADALKLNELYLLCLVFITNNFRYVATTEQFMTLSYDEIMLLVKNDNLFAKEAMVYDVIMDWIKHDMADRFKHTIHLLWYTRMPLILNTYQGLRNSYELQNAKINNDCSFRLKYRKPFKKGILMFSHEPSNLSPEWYDATSEKWYDCENRNCPCKTFQVILALPKRLSTCILLNDGRLFAAGGYEAGHELKSAYIFDLKSNTWVHLSNMRNGRVRPYIVQIGTKIYTIGGCHRSIELTLLIEYYDLMRNMFFPVHYETNTFEIMKKSVFVTSVDKLIYIIGTNRAMFYDTSVDSWNPIPVLPDQRENAAICTLYGNIYIIGGDNCYGHLKSVLAFCTETKLWVSVADMNFPRSNAGTVVMNGLIYVFGGNIDHDNVSDTFEVYNPHDDEWITSDACMKKGRFNIDAIVINKTSILYKRVFKQFLNFITH